MGRRRNELRNVAGLISKLRIIVAIRSEDPLLCAKFSAPHFWLVPPHFICSGYGTGGKAIKHCSEINKTSLISHLTLIFAQK